MAKLAVNVDHVATVRQARRADEPDPVAAAVLAEIAGADAIIAHLREDRRHIQDRDVRLLRDVVSTRFNLEMGLAPEIVKIALDLKPHQATFVPEKRLELTTEGGLDAAADPDKIRDHVKRFHDAGVQVSLFVDPEPRQLDAAFHAGADIVELHTGEYANAKSEKDRKTQLDRVGQAAKRARAAGLAVFAGHGLTYRNVTPVAAIREIEEFSIGHSIASRAMLVGFERAVREMKDLILRAR